MTEGSPDRPDQSGARNEGVDEDIAGAGDEGGRAARVSPPIADDTEPGRDTSPALPDDVGVPPDDDLAEPGK